MHTIDDSVRVSTLVELAHAQRYTTNVKWKKIVSSQLLANQAHRRLPTPILAVVLVVSFASIDVHKCTDPAQQNRTLQWQRKWGYHYPVSLVWSAYQFKLVSTARLLLAFLISHLHIVTLFQPQQRARRPAWRCEHFCSFRWGPRSSFSRRFSSLF